MTNDLLLLPQHQKLILASGIKPEVAQARKYQSVTVKADLRKRGFSENQCSVPALLIPLYDYRGEIVNYQIRPDSPRINQNGKPVKYETPGRSSMLIDVPPLVGGMVMNPEHPLFITEGVRKADCAVGAGLCCIDLLGVWNWRGSNGHGGTAPLPDWEYIPLKGREVYIVFDSDVMTKPNVHSALKRLKTFLECRGAEVKLICFPPGEDGAKVGLDDFLAAGHTVGELLSLATSELRPCEAEGQSRRNPYSMDAEGLIFHKPVGDGTVPVLLTNFLARIVADVLEDDGAETRHVFAVEAKVKGSVSTFTLPATQFNSMNWAVQHLGAGAIIMPGFATRDHARAAIQYLSDNIENKRVYLYTGWCQVEGEQVYLHAGGAIGRNGSLTSVVVHLPDALGLLRLPDPPTPEALHKAIHASLRTLDLAADDIMFPLFASIYRSVIGEADFSLHLGGPTGAGKTELAALAQQHWGSGLDARHLPGCWSSTGNALEAIAFAAKDALLVVDDFTPAGTSNDVARQHREANRLLRAQGNSAGRQRMRADTTLRAGKHPRGIILSTGEDVPRGQSLRARILILELPPDGLNFRLLTQCQRDARAGLYSQCLSGFVMWIAQNPDIRTGLREEIEHIRDSDAGCGHRRTPAIVADLAAALSYFLRFAVESGAMSVESAQAMQTRGYNAIRQSASRQEQHQAASEPTQRFIQLIGAAIASGHAHVAGLDGLEPESSESWGWRRTQTGVGDYSREDWRPQGDRIGWLDKNDLYLQPDAALAVAQRIAQASSLSTKSALRG